MVHSFVGSPVKTNRMRLLAVELNIGQTCLWSRKRALVGRIPQPRWLVEEEEKEEEEVEGGVPSVVLARQLTARVGRWKEGKILSVISPLSPGMQFSIGWDFYSTLEIRLCDQMMVWFTCLVCWIPMEF